jgi:hypothetical protein
MFSSTEASPDNSVIIDIPAEDPPYSQLTDELSATEKEALAYYVLRRSYDSTKSLSGNERFLAVIAGIVAAATASSSKEFGDEFMQGFQKLTGINSSGSEWGIAIPSVFAQFSLSANSCMIVLTKLMRNLQRPANEAADKYEKKLTKKEIAMLAAIPFGSLAAYKIGFDASEHYGWPSAINHGLGSMRFFAMVGVNNNYASDQLKKWQRNNYNLPIVCALDATQKHLVALAKADDPTPFLAALNESGLLKNLDHLGDTADAKHHQHLELLVAGLLKVAPQNILSTPNQKSNFVAYLSLVLGILTTLTKFKAGSMATNPFGLQAPKDLVEFFKNIHGASNQLIAAAAIGGILFGIPAWFLNTIINAKSCMLLIDDATAFAADIRQQGWSAYFQKISRVDGMFLGLISLMGAGYGLGYGGAGYKYSPVDIDPVPILNMAFSGIGYTAVGIASMKKFVAGLRNGWDRSVLDDALNSDDLLTHYHVMQQDPDKQKTLIRVLRDYVNHALEAQLDSFNKLDEVAVNSLFSPSLQQKLNEKFGLELKEIVIETPVDRDALTSIRIV